jgi:hypothetical protein
MALAKKPKNARAASHPRDLCALRWPPTTCVHDLVGRLGGAVYKRKLALRQGDLPR